MNRVRPRNNHTEVGYISFKNIMARELTWSVVVRHAALRSKDWLAQIYFK